MMKIQRIKKWNETVDVFSSVVESLPDMHKVLGWIPNKYWEKTKTKQNIRGM
jgi:hypothetical protein